MHNHGLKHPIGTTITSSSRLVVFYRHSVEIIAILVIRDLLKRCDALKPCEIQGTKADTDDQEKCQQTYQNP